MSPHDIGNLLESYGIETHANMGGGVEALVHELSHGRKVIAGVDSGELWGDDFFFSVSVSHTAYTDPAVDRYASGCPNDDPPNNGALC